MIGCRSIDDQNFYSLEHGIKPSMAYYEKVFLSQGQKYGSGQLVKVRAADGANDLHNQELLMCPHFFSNCTLTLT